MELTKLDPGQGVTVYALQQRAQTLRSHIPGASLAKAKKMLAEFERIIVTLRDAEWTESAREIDPRVTAEYAVPELLQAMGVE